MIILLSIISFLCHDGRIMSNHHEPSRQKILSGNGPQGRQEIEAQDHAGAAGEDAGWPWKIPLTQGKFALVDEDVFYRASKLKWSLSNGYAANSSLGYLHRFVFGETAQWKVRFLSANKFDCRRSNLRSDLELQSQDNSHPNGARKIFLLGGGFALVDRCDYESLVKIPWSRNDQGYVITSVGCGGDKTRHIRMHRMIMNPPDDVLVDHKNQDRSDNRRSNLRLADKSQNGCNRGVQRNTKSGLKGAHYHKQTGRWCAKITKDGASLFLGIFDTPEQAHEAYKEASRKIHKEYSGV